MGDESAWGLKMGSLVRDGKGGCRPLSCLLEHANHHPLARKQMALAHQLLPGASVFLSVVGLLRKGEGVGLVCQRSCWLVLMGIGGHEHLEA